MVPHSARTIRREPPFGGSRRYFDRTTSAGSKAVRRYNLNMSTTTQPHEATIFDGLNADISPAAATAILSFGFSDKQKNRMSEVAAKARDGSITTDERDEADSFERVSSLIGMLQSKA